ncbi:lymphotoxin-beta [Discoglossus pictus]
MGAGHNGASQAASVPSANRMKRWQRQNANKTAAHLIGISPPMGNMLKWESKNDQAFIRHQVQYGKSKLEVHQDGLYYVYCQIGFHGKEANITLSNQVYIYHDSDPEELVLLSGTDSVMGPANGLKPWFSSLSQGGLARLESGHLLFVKVSHPELVDYNSGKTFFGILMVS